MAQLRHVDVRDAVLLHETDPVLGKPPLGGGVEEPTIPAGGAGGGVTAVLTKSRQGLKGASHAAVGGGVEVVARVAGVAAGWSRALVAGTGAGIAFVGVGVEEEALVAGDSVATEDIKPRWAEDGVACNGPDV